MSYFSFLAGLQHGGHAYPMDSSVYSEEEDFDLLSGEESGEEEDFITDQTDLQRPKMMSAPSFTLPKMMSCHPDMFPVSEDELSDEMKDPSILNPKMIPSQDDLPEEPKNLGALELQQFDIPSSEVKLPPLSPAPEMIQMTLDSTELENDSKPSETLRLLKELRDDVDRDIQRFHPLNLMDYIPFVATIKAIAVIALKSLSPVLPSSIKESHLYTQLTQATWLRSLLFIALPVISSLVVGLYDYYASNPSNADSHL